MRRRSADIGAEGLTLYSAGFYGQDEWKVRPNFTLTLAIRLDRNSNIRCSAGCFNELVAQPFDQLNHSVTTPYNSSIVTGLKEAFPSVEPIVAEPRVGFAYSPTNSFVIRGGFGIFSDLYQGLIADRLITNSPAVASFTTTSGTVALNDPNSAFAAVANSYNAFRAGFANGATLAQLKPLSLWVSIRRISIPLATSYITPSTTNGTFKSSRLSAAARGCCRSITSGTKGTRRSIKRFMGMSMMRLMPSRDYRLPRPDPRFGEIRELGNQGYSNYNGLVTK